MRSRVERTWRRLIGPLLAAALVPGCSVVRGEPDVAPFPEPPVASPDGPVTDPVVDVRLPRLEGSYRFAVIGDSGTGGTPQREVAAMMARYRQAFDFTDVLMLGDNIYEPDTPADFREKFEEPYAALLAAGVKFRAALGNHDSRNQTHYAHFNMNGERYYTYKPRNGVRFFAVDSNYLDQPQLEWLRKELAASGSEWKIVFQHHPLYSSGDRHGPAEDKREVLEPILLEGDVSLVLQGHEHFYERLLPQKGIHYITSGGAGKLRPGRNVSELTAKGFDDDYQFMLMEIAGDELYFQTISRVGATIDSGVLRRRGAAASGTSAAAN